jgi:nucleoid DNA-binding protein
MAEKKDNGGKAKTKSQVINDLAAETSLSRKDVTLVLDALTNLIKQELGKKGPGKMTVPGLFKLTRIHKPKVKGGQVKPNPFKPGETIVTKDRPARTDVRVRALKGLKEMVQ